MTKKSRNTIQNQFVLEAVQNLKNHPTAEEIYDYILKKYGKISIATIYSNLQSLSLEGKIKRLDLPNVPTRYDHQTFNQYHFLCKKCGKLFDSDVPFNNLAMQQIKENSKFVIDEVNVILTGTCPDCINEKKEEIK